MSLNFSVKNIKGYDEKYSQGEFKEEWHYITNAIVFQSMSVGMSGITEANYEKWFRRIHITEKVMGAFLRNNLTGNPHYLTLEDVKGHIGLTVNVSTISDAAFKKKVWDSLVLDADEELYYQGKKLSEDA